MGLDLEMGSKSKHEFICVSYIHLPNAQSLTVILYSIFDNFMHETEFHGVEFSMICGICQSPESFGFWGISDL
jgi:hypothetical protein